VEGAGLEESEHSSDYDEEEEANDPHLGLVPVRNWEDQYDSYDDEDRR
jgi:hypothetical protein